MRFLAEANLRQIIRREERHVDAGQARAELNDRIRDIFNGKTFNTVPFPGGPFDVPDEVGDGRPKLVVLSYDAVIIGSSVESVPELIEKIYARKGSEGSALRALRNNLAFAVADEARRDDMQRKTYQRLALQELKKPERLDELAEHQQAKVRELAARSEQELAIAIQQCYRHVFYPSRNRVGRSEVDLAHSAIDMQSTSDQPGAGQQQIVRALRDLGKLRLAEDEPDSPAYVRDPRRMVAVATPQVTSPLRVAGLQGRNLGLFELPPRSPELNGSVERVNAAWRYEFYACWQLPDDNLDTLNLWIDAFADEFNTYRPHQGLTGMTPAQYLHDIAGVDPVRRAHQPRHWRGRLHPSAATALRRPSSPINRATVRRATTMNRPVFPGAVQTKR